MNEVYQLQDRRRRPRLVSVGEDAMTPEQWSYFERRLERRRKQWRDSKRRAKLRDGRPEPVGYLHALSCSGPAQHRFKPTCKPIPCYTRTQFGTAFGERKP